ncbi:MAG: nuclease-related domain-containing protein [Rudaea sp.]
MAQIYTNEPFVENRARIGRYASFAGLAIIFGGLIASFQENIILAYGALIVGFVVSNFGAYFMNRYGMNTYKKLNEAIKGLDKRFSLYNYYLPVPNVLLTPFGLVVLLLKNQDGKIVGTKEGWRQGSSLLRILRAFSSEGLGDPPRELREQQAKLGAFVKEHLGQGFSVPIEGYVIFTNPAADVTIKHVDTPIIVLKQEPDALKNALRRDRRTQALQDPSYNALVKLFAETAEERLAQEEQGWRFWQR